MRFSARSKLAALAVFSLLLAASSQGCVPPGDGDDSPGLGGKTDDPRDADQRFLVSDGVGSEDSAIDYYASLDRNLVPGEYTLTEWLDENIGARPTQSSLYRNSHELGFWREMTCTTFVGRGMGGCWVRNWSDPDGPSSGKPDLGTVAMNVSPEGFTRFFVFAPGGKLSPFAILDDEGAKYVPNVCVACHNGTYDPENPGADLNAVFREFEPSMLEPASLTSGTAEQWFRLNQSVRSANTSLRSQPEGAGARVDHARAAQEAYLRAMYPTTSSVDALDVRDPRHLPESWQQTLGVTPSLVAAKRELWTQVVAPYCMTCHRTNDMNWAEYASFEFLALDIDGRPFIDHYLADVDEHDANLAFMPQAKLLFDEVQSDPAVGEAIANWVDALGGPTCEVGTECTPTELCRRGVIQTCDASKLECAAAQPLPDGTACGVDGSCVDGSCVPTLVIVIPQIPTRVYVRNQRPDSPEAHVQLAVDGGGLLIRQLDLERSCSIASSQVRLPCNVSTLTCTDSATGDSWTVTGGGTLERKSPSRPERAGTYRIESPVSIASCP